MRNARNRTLGASIIQTRQLDTVLHVVSSHHNLEIKMKTCLATLTFVAVTTGFGNVSAQTTTKPAEPMMKNDTMSMQQCKDHMAMPKNAGMAKDEAMMKKDTMCTDMMKKDGMMMNKDGTMMKKDGVPADPMKK